MRQIRSIAIACVALLPMPGFALTEVFNTHATDIMDPSSFGFNPAAINKGSTYVAAYTDHRSGENSLLVKDTEDQRNSKTSATVIALGLIGDMSGGLTLGLCAQDWQMGDSSFVGTSSKSPIDESFNTSILDFKAAFDLSPIFRMGLAMHGVRIANRLVGAYYLDTDDSGNYTAFNTFMFGPAIGIIANTGPNRFALAYQLPLRGNTVIRDEEKIISQPGMAEAAFTATFQPWTIGAGARKFFYKRDDRSAGTTIAGKDSASIDLFGLNVDRNTLFLASQIFAGIDFNAGSRWILKTTVTQNYIDYTDYDKRIPVSEFTDYSYYRYQMSIVIPKQDVSLALGAAYTQPKITNFETQRNVVYKARELSLFGALTWTL